MPLLRGSYVSAALARVETLCLLLALLALEGAIGGTVLAGVEAPGEGGSRAGLTAPLALVQS